MKAAFFAVACLLLAGSASASRALSSTTANSCFAYGSVSLVVKSGSCKGWSGATCKSHAHAEAKFRDAMDFETTDALCKPVSAKAATGAVARAVARVYVQALSKVSCNGQGFGCGYAVASGDSFATAYSRSVARAAAAAFNGPLSAVCVADIEALAVAISAASGQAITEACVNGPGSSFAFESRFVQVVSKAITRVIASAGAFVCKGKKDDQAKCGADVFGSSNVKPTIINKPNSNSGSTGSGTNSGSNTGSFLSQQVLACHDFKAGLCCRELEKKGLALGAPNCAALGMTAGPPTNGLGSAHLIFKDPFGKSAKCFCH